MLTESSSSKVEAAFNDYITVPPGSEGASQDIVARALKLYKFSIQDPGSGFDGGSLFVQLIGSDAEAEEVGAGTQLACNLPLRCPPTGVALTLATATTLVATATTRHSLGLASATATTLVAIATTLDYAAVRVLLPM